MKIIRPKESAEKIDAPQLKKFPMSGHIHEKVQNNHSISGVGAERRQFIHLTELHGIRGPCGLVILRIRRIRVFRADSVSFRGLNSLQPSPPPSSLKGYNPIPLFDREFNLPV